MATSTTSNKITDEQIRHAAMSLMFSGQPWGVNAVQKKLGGGGTGRMADVIKEMKERLAEAGYIALPDSVPEELQTAFAAIWKAACEHGHATVVAAKVEAETERDKALGELAAIKDASSKAADEVEQMRSTIGALKSELVQSKTLLEAETKQLDSERANAAKAAESHKNQLATAEAVSAAKIETLESQLAAANALSHRQEKEFKQREESLLKRHERELADERKRSEERHNAQQDFYTKQVEAAKVEASAPIAGLKETNASLTGKLESLQEKYSEATARNAALTSEVSSLKDWLGEARERLHFIDLNSAGTKSDTKGA